MATGFAYSERFLEHLTGPQHPERPDRLRAIVERLKAQHLWDLLVHLPVAPAERRWIEAVHEPRYVQRVQDACEMGEPYVDVVDSAVCPESYQIALLAVGAVLGAVDAVQQGRVENAFCAVRPPGHHAEFDRSMGFCLFNNVAIAAHYLIARHGLQRVAVVDFDVHHGNGTQHLFEARADVLVVSVHEHPSYLYPGTGFGWETGRGEGEGFTLNVPLDPGCGDEDYRRAVLFKVSPALERFQPQFLLLSAGFDAAASDPLAHMQVTPSGFQWMTRHLKRLAERLCDGRVVSVLEGGYNLQALSESVTLHLAALMQESGEDDLMAMKVGL